MNNKCCKCRKDAKFYHEWRYADKDPDRIYYCTVNRIHGSTLRADEKLFKSPCM